MSRCTGVDSSLPTFIEFRTLPLASEARESREFEDHREYINENDTTTPPIIDATTGVAIPDVAEVSRYDTIDRVSSKLTVASGPLPPQISASSNAVLTETHHTQSLGSSLPWTRSDAPAEAFSFDLYLSSPIQQQFNFTEFGLDDEAETGVSGPRLSAAAEDYFPAFEQRPASRNAFLNTPPRTIFNFDWIDMWTSRIPFLQFEEHLKLQGMLLIHGMKNVRLVSNCLMSNNSHQQRHPLSAFSTTPVSAQD